MRDMEHVDTIVIGGGQAGLSVGYYLKRLGRPFVILDANDRVGDAWRKRWDSLRLFTPARYAGLRGSRFPGRGDVYPTKDEVADYLETYARRFDLPIRTGVRVDELSSEDGRYAVTAGGQRFDADNVVVATGAHGDAHVPAFAGELDPTIVQLHSSRYRNPSQLQEGGVLVVGAGNSGADIAIEVVRSHPTWMSGRDTGHIPIRIESAFGRHVLTRIVVFVGHRVLTLRTPIGRRMRAKVLTQAGPLVRVKPKDLARAGVERVERVTGVRDGLPMLADGRVLDVANVIWCTGFRHDLSWIRLPIFDDDRRPMHRRGVVPSQPGLYFMGLVFQYALSSDVLPGVGRDARHVVKHLASRVTSASPSIDTRVA